MRFYIYLQYSAIQKAVLRHDRLWSIAGMSQALSRLNEVDLPAIVSRFNGKTFVAGGGKFTARLEAEDKASQAREEIIKLLTTTLPLLEFQISEVIPAESLAKAQEPKIKEDGSVEYPGIINALNEQKRCFRGYGLTFNPHFMVCKECGEYPAVKKKHKDEAKFVCSICLYAEEVADIKLQGLKDTADIKLTSIEKIYKKYAGEINEDKAAIPTNFEDLFPFDENSEEGKKRLAVWSSDINGMGDKVTVWLRQEEDKIKETFDKVKDVNITIVSTALKETFPTDKLIKKDKTYIPFRLIVAGGDDLCIVMKDKDILKFVKNISNALNDEIKGLKDNHPLNLSWLKDAREKEQEENKKADKQEDFKPHSFGGSFIVTPIHTPFKKLHHAAEELMSTAKKETGRQGNSVNWLIMSADEKPERERLLGFEKPLFIDKESGDKLTFNDYMKLAEKYKNLSGSHTQQIVGKMIEFRKYENPEKLLDTWLKRKPAASKETSKINELLHEKDLQENGGLNLRRLATLLELMSI